MPKQIEKTPEKRHDGRRRTNKPNIVHPTIPGAIGSLESPYRNGRDAIADSKLIIDEITDKIRGH